MSNHTSGNPINPRPTLFIWDGSYLGLIDDLNVKNKTEYRKLAYWTISIHGHIEVCIVKAITSADPCLIDELKVIFKLPKLGTHRVRYKSSIYLLIRTRSKSDGSICYEPPLNTVTIEDTIFIKQIQEIYIFRDILGITRTMDSSIVVRYPNQSYLQPYPVSFIEIHLRPDDNNPIIPSTAIERWFDDSLLNDVARSMFQINTIDEVLPIISKFKDRVTQIIERVNRDDIWMVRMITERLRSRLLFGLTCE